VGRVEKRVKTKDKDSYPTWKGTGNHGWVSEEGQYNSLKEWVPDFQIVREGPKDFRLKWRTSAHWSGPYESGRAAKIDVESQMNARSIRYTDI